ncbi:hypothetical protein PVL29_021887 [Vitis rotundifolia]|uniref:Uncharacterized protein n=1 Tax=Vitis rotundifolia TaxID=103349 RepID=A0AA38YTW3_VITRO|nr:hypothetical protein PVL29_021887 [Vitis rotundifolia]
MKIKRKGKVYPSSSSSSSSYKDAISVFKLLPATILALASALSVDDREVLAYMITRSMTTANPSSIIERQKKKCKTPHNVQKLPLFECGCFDCYTSFWFRWDSSPDRELIHHAIEAFEDQLTTTEFFKKNGRGRKRDKLVGRRDAERSADISEEKRTEPEPLKRRRHFPFSVFSIFFNIGQWPFALGRTQLRMVENGSKMWANDISLWGALW